MDRDFLADHDGLHHAVDLLRRDQADAEPIALPDRPLLATLLAWGRAGLAARIRTPLLADAVLGAL